MTLYDTPSKAFFDTGSNPVGSTAFYSGKHDRYSWLSDVDLLAVTTT